MTSTLLPFLYQTRTLRRAFGSSSASHLARLVHTSRKPKARRPDNSIPFVWDSAAPYGESEPSEAPVSTITPSEANIFKNIFDEIAQGRMPSAKKRPAASEPDSGDATAASPLSGTSRLNVEQARVTEFREKFLQRYPQSLRDAAQVALGLYELKPGESESGKGRIIEMDGGNQEKWKGVEKYGLERAQELERVEGLMNACDTDEALWKVMEEQVFSLPKKLGILENPSKSKGKATPSKKAVGLANEASEDSQGMLSEAEGEETAKESDAENEEERRLMDIHGPLYSRYLSTALGLFEIAFAHPSPYVFQILPRVKELGLPSYVLGMSTAFYSRLARIHWQQFGDANSSLDVLQEMNAVGLYQDANVRDLIGMIRDNLHGCLWGAQGNFVVAMMESPSFDSLVMQKLEAVEETMRRSLEERARG